MESMDEELETMVADNRAGMRRVRFAGDDTPREMFSFTSPSTVERQDFHFDGEESDSQSDSSKGSNKRRQTDAGDDELSSKRLRSCVMTESILESRRQVCLYENTNDFSKIENVLNVVSNNTEKLIDLVMNRDDYEVVLHDYTLAENLIFGDIFKLFQKGSKIVDNTKLIDEVEAKIAKFHTKMDEVLCSVQ